MGAGLEMLKGLSRLWDPVPSTMEVTYQPDWDLYCQVCNYLVSWFTTHSLHVDATAYCPKSSRAQEGMCLPPPLGPVQCMTTPWVFTHLEGMGTPNLGESPGGRAWM